MGRIVGAVLCRDPITPVFHMPSDPGTATTFFLQARTDLSTINPHQHDKALRFEPDGHKYFCNDSAIGCSVPGL